jgi:hypothetical protein
MIGPCGLLLVVSHLFAVTILVLWMGLEKGKKTELGCQNYFCRVTYRALLGMLEGNDNEIANQSNPMLTKIHVWINFALAN